MSTKTETTEYYQIEYKSPKHENWAQCTILEDTLSEAAKTAASELFEAYQTRIVKVTTITTREII